MMLIFGAMAAETATIRVTRATRDTFAAQARAQGISLASLLAELARERQSELALRSERDASRLDSERSEVGEERAAWEATLADGLD